MDLSTHFRSHVVIRNKFPESVDDENSVLIYDKALLKTPENSEIINGFVDSFSNSVGFKGGEELKSFSDLPKNLEKILKVWPEPMKRSQTLYVLGGGSLGDFGGFVSSVLKRGVKLVQIPSTWLAAMDSAHGGKNALNYKNLKNQIGTFYPADKVYIIRDLLESAPEQLLEQAYGELIKMALIGESMFFKEIANEKREPQDFTWRFLKFCIEDKYQVVLQDPYETKKIRQILNFGHSLGHAFESHFKWSHGDSVLQGIFFSLEWSRERGELSKSMCQRIHQVIAEKFDRIPARELGWYRRPSSKAIKKLLLADKKIAHSGQLNFVFLKNIGKPVVKAVDIDELIAEAKRQNWLK